MDLQALRRYTDAGLATLQAQSTILDRERDALGAVQLRIRALDEAQALAQHVAQQVQSQAFSKISSLVTRCLEVFAEPYTFSIKLERKRGKVEAYLLFLKDGMEVDPLTAAGGGCVDVAAFALRLACLCLKRPAARKLLVLDEPFKNPSEEYMPRIRALLEILSRELKVQILLVTHEAQLKTGTIVPLSM